MACARLKTTINAIRPAQAVQAGPPSQVAVLLFVHVLWVAALVINLLSLLIVWLRLAYLRRFAPAGNAPAMVILPLTGAAPGLEALMAALNRQTLLPSRLLIAVESAQDPAYARAHAVAGMAGFPLEIVVAGLAASQAQKCRNQQAALERLGDAGDGVIVFMDADILPCSDWLGVLVAPAAAGRADVVSGRRWYQPEGHALGAHLIAAIDRTISLLPHFKARLTRTAWGGSLAITAGAARRLDLHALLGRTLSDDLSIARGANALGMRVVTRSTLLAPTPSRQALGAAWCFARRQYQMCRLYFPGLWWLALGVVGTRLAGWLAAVAALFSGGPAALALPALALTSLLRQHGVAEFARRLGLPDAGAARAAQMLLGLLQPVVDVFHLSAVLGAGRARIVRWGHVTYRVRAPDRIEIVARRAPEWPAGDGPGCGPGPGGSGA